MVRSIVVAGVLAGALVGGPRPVATGAVAPGALSFVTAIPGSGELFGLDPVAHIIFTSTGSGDATEINTLTNTVVATAQVPEEIYNIAVDSATDTFFTADLDTYGLEAINGATLTSTQLNVADTSTTAVDSTTGLVYISNIDPLGDLGVFDPRSGTLVHTIPFSSNSMAIDGPRRRLYLATSTGVDVVSLVTDRLIASVPLTGGAADLAIDLRTHAVYATMFLDDSLAVINGTTLHAVSYPAGSRPVGVVVDSANRTVYVANVYSQTITALDANTGQILQTEPIDYPGAANSVPTELGVDPATHLVYALTNNETLDVFASTRPAITAPTLPEDDFDDTGASLPAVVDRSGHWTLQGQPGIAFGIAGDMPTVTEDAAGIAHLTQFRPSTGEWYIRDRGQMGKRRWGQTGDIPVAAHYSGAQAASVLAVFRPGNGRWYILGQSSFRYGERGDIPVPGHYYGSSANNYADQAAIYRPATNQWWIRGHGAVHYGRSGDIPVPADYDGNGTTDIAVYRPSTGQWWIRGHAPVRYGVPGDIPVTGDFGGDGHADIAVYRPSTRTWWVRGIGKLVLGATGSTPIDAAPFHS